MALVSEVEGWVRLNPRKRELKWRSHDCPLPLPREENFSCICGRIWQCVTRQIDWDNPQELPQVSRNPIPGERVLPVRDSPFATNRDWFPKGEMKIDGIPLSQWRKESA